MLVQGKLEAAEPLCEKAIAVWADTLGESHSKVATAINNLGQIKYAQSRLEEAGPLYEKAIALWKALGKGPMATGLNNLAGLRKQQASARMCAFGAAGESPPPRPRRGDCVRRDSYTERLWDRWSKQTRFTPKPSAI